MSSPEQQRTQMATDLRLVTERAEKMRVRAEREERMRRDAEWKLTQIMRLHTPTDEQWSRDEGYPFERICTTCGSGEPHEYPVSWPCETRRIVDEEDA